MDEGFAVLGKVAQKVVVQELPAVIRVKAQKGKGQGSFNILDLFKNTGFTFASDGTLFGPSGCDVNEVDGVDVLAF